MAMSAPASATADGFPTAHSGYADGCPGCGYADGCSGCGYADGCSGGCGYVAQGLCNGGCGYGGYAGYAGYAEYPGQGLCNGGCGYQGFLPSGGFVPTGGEEEQEVCTSTTELSAEPNPAQEGESITLTATVNTVEAPENGGEPVGIEVRGTVNPEPQPATGGTVTFYVNGNAEAEESVENGQASTPVSLPPGTYEAYAVWSGADDCEGSTSETIPIEVTAAPTPPPAPPSINIGGQHQSQRQSVNVKVVVVGGHRYFVKKYAKRMVQVMPATPSSQEVPVTG